jgi:hypothetical protein
MKKVLNTILKFKVGFFVLGTGIFVLLQNNDVVGVALIACSISMFDSNDNK